MPSSTARHCCFEKAASSRRVQRARAGDPVVDVLSGSLRRGLAQDLLA